MKSFRLYKPVWPVCGSKNSARTMDLKNDLLRYLPFEKKIKS